MGTIHNPHLRDKNPPACHPHAWKKADEMPRETKAPPTTSSPCSFVARCHSPGPYPSIPLAGRSPLPTTRCATRMGTRPHSATVLLLLPQYQAAMPHTVLPASTAECRAEPLCPAALWGAPAMHLAACTRAVGVPDIQQQRGCSDHPLSHKVCVGVPGSAPSSALPHPTKIPPQIPQFLPRSHHKRSQTEQPRPWGAHPPHTEASAATSPALPGHTALLPAAVSLRRLISSCYPSAFSSCSALEVFFFSPPNLLRKKFKTSARTVMH